MACCSPAAINSSLLARTGSLNKAKRVKASGSTRSDGCFVLTLLCPLSSHYSATDSLASYNQCDAVEGVVEVTFRVPCDSKRLAHLLVISRFCPNFVVARLGECHFGVERLPSAVICWGCEFGIHPCCAKINPFSLHYRETSGQITLLWWINCCQETVC